MYEAAIQNVTGYAGLSAALLLHRHPEFRLVAVSGRGEAGKRLSDVFPFWPGDDLMIEGRTPSVDLVVSALPHGAAADAIAPVHAAGSRVVDISADFRLRDADLYARWYGTHPFPRLLEEAAYGLPELHRSEIERSRLIGNPGCYPTAAILALVPALQAGIVEPSVVVDAKSGVSGSGRSPNLGNQFSEIDASVHAYGLQGHRHSAEITQELSAVAGTPVETLFTPHLIPMARGLLATCYARLLRPVSGADLLDVYRRYYMGQPFVRVVTESPRTKWSSGTNMCFVYPALSHTGTHLIAMAAIDNLVKGAAGQAVQNANLLFGLPETMGLDQLPGYP